MKRNRLMVLLVIILCVLVSACSGISENNEKPVKQLTIGERMAMNKEECAIKLQENVDVQKLYGSEATEYGMCLLINDRYREAKDLFYTLKAKRDNDEVLNILYDSATFLESDESTFDDFTKFHSRFVEVRQANNNILLNNVEEELWDKSKEIDAKYQSSLEGKAKKAQREYDKIHYVPKIGMTAEEVKGSKWGEPSDINKTTTKYGVHEQWVYSGNRYVYLEDGIVTTIQE